MADISKERAIQIARSDWRTTGGRLLSLGDMDDPFFESFKRAHAPSVLRAINYNGYNNEARTARLIARELGQTTYKRLFEMSSRLSKSDFDKEIYGEGGLLDSIRDIYQKNRILDYTYGNAQKLIFVAAKYLLSSNLISPDNVFFEYIGIPIDRNIISWASEYGFQVPSIVSWSKCDNKNTIMKFEAAVESEVKKRYNIAPLFWECCIWNQNNLV